jgi:hypothetical protein
MPRGPKSRKKNILDNNPNTFDNTNISFTRPTQGFPPKIIIKSLNKRIDGVYEFMTTGGEGILYLHSNKKYVLKLLYFGGYDLLYYQIKLQLEARDIAPKIYAYSKKTNAIHIDNKDTYGYIMEYLKKPVLLGDFLQTETNWIKLYKLLYTLIFIYKLNLGLDWLGYTGDHLFIKDNKIYLIDFGKITKQDGSITSKTLYESALKDVVHHGNISFNKELFIEKGLSFLTQTGGVLRKKYKRRVRRSRRKHTRRLRKKY